MLSDLHTFFLENGENICFCYLFLYVYNSYTKLTNSKTTRFKYTAKIIVCLQIVLRCVFLSLQGALAVSFSIFGTSFLFIDSHFTCKFSFLVWTNVIGNKIVNDILILTKSNDREAYFYRVEEMNKCWWTVQTSIYSNQML